MGKRCTYKSIYDMGSRRFRTLKHPDPHPYPTIQQPCRDCSDEKTVAATRSTDLDPPHPIPKHGSVFLSCLHSFRRIHYHCRIPHATRMASKEQPKCQPTQARVDVVFSLGDGCHYCYSQRPRYAAMWASHAGGNCQTRRIRNDRATRSS